jgi:hypothetical protein
MTPAPADQVLIHQRTYSQHSARESLAEHKINQKRIMGMAARRGLIVQYYKREWRFLKPDGTQEHLPMAMPDEKAIEWLTSASYSELGR